MTDFIFKKISLKKEKPMHKIKEIISNPEDYILIAGIKNDEVNIKIRKRNDEDPV